VTSTDPKYESRTRRTYGGKSFARTTPHPTVLNAFRRLAALGAAAMRRPCTDCSGTRTATRTVQPRWRTSGCSSGSPTGTRRSLDVVQETQRTVRRRLSQLGEKRQLSALPPAGEDAFPQVEVEHVS